MGEAKPAAMSPEALEFFERLLALDPPTQQRELEALRQARPDLHPQVVALVESDRRAAARSFLESTPRLAGQESAPTTLAPGQKLGAYRIERQIAAGGMGEIWLGVRADGHYEGKVAIKILRPTAAHSALRERFVREGQILAGLSHPNIARLLDAGTTDAGFLYLVLEYIEGERIDHWCDRHGFDVVARVRVFLQVCAAVSHAHARLVVHRDLKPSNILVTAHGTAKLLDFGIAKLMEPEGRAPASELTRISGRVLTPEYAAPEQVRGEAITTATDVYSLGVILFALLAGRRPYGDDQSSPAQLERDVTDTEPRRLSDAAPRERRRALRGDLDKVVAKAIRKLPAERYPSVEAFAEDLQHYLNFEPVTARRDAFSYRARMFVRRHPLGMAAATTVCLAIVTGIGATLWQAQKAKAEAARATAKTEFLYDLFRANDPRLLAARPDGQLTARDMLEIAVGRVEKEFASQPELQIELLYNITEIFGYMGDPRYGPMADALVERSRALYGPRHPMVLKAMFEQLYSIGDTADYAKGLRVLEETDAVLKALDLDNTADRALWWLFREDMLKGGDLGSEAERREALTQAVRIYERLGSTENNYSWGIGRLALLEVQHGEYEKGCEGLQRALTIAEQAPDRFDGLVTRRQRWLAHCYELLGRYAEADALYERSEQLGRVANNSWAGQGWFWVSRAQRARMWHRRGERQRAHVLFAELMPLIVADGFEKNDARARAAYGEALLAEGRVTAAIPHLEFAYRRHEKLPYFDDVVRASELLGDAYDRVGWLDEARALLDDARSWRMRHDAAGGDPDTLRIRERWGRFLLDHAKPADPEFALAEREFRAVLEKAGGRPWVEPALALAGLARISLARGDVANALNQSRDALAALERTTIAYDVRVEPQIWLVHSAALRASGDRAGAREWAQKAFAASRRYDDPSAESIKRARAALR